MTGLISTIHHIGPILLIYLFSLLFWFLVKRQIVKIWPSTMTFMPKISKILFGATSTVAILTIVLVLGFLSNPFERVEIKTINTSSIDESFTPKSSDEISRENKDITQKQHVEKEIKATTDNQKAFEDSKNIFK